MVGDIGTYDGLEIADKIAGLKLLIILGIWNSFLFTNIIKLNPQICHLNTKRRNDCNIFGMLVLMMTYNPDGYYIIPV